LIISRLHIAAVGGPERRPVDRFDGLEAGFELVFWAGSVGIVIAIASGADRPLNDLAIVRVNKKMALHAGLRCKRCLLDIADELLFRLGDFRRLLGAGGPNPCGQAQGRKADKMAPRYADSGLQCHANFH
jgi:hypothetical protein